MKMKLNDFRFSGTTNSETLGSWNRRTEMVYTFAFHPLVKRIKKSCCCKLPRTCHIIHHNFYKQALGEKEKFKTIKKEKGICFRKRWMVLSLAYDSIMMIRFSSFLFYYYYYKLTTNLSV